MVESVKREFGKTFNGIEDSGGALPGGCGGLMAVIEIAEIFAHRKPGEVAA